MPLNFPADPEEDDTFTSGGVTWTFDGTGWVITGSSGGGPSGAVDSVNGQTGDVVLTIPDSADDIGAAATSHTHAGSDVTSGTVPFARIPTGTSSSQVAVGNHNHDGTYATSSHSHAGSDITSGTVGFARLPTGTGSSNVAVGDHNHTGVYAASSHSHAASDTTSGTFDIARIPTGTSGTTAALGNHTHAASAVTSGTLDIARIPTGTSGSTVALGNHGHTDLVAKSAGIVTVDAGSNLSTTRPSGADVVYWMFDNGTAVGTSGENIVNAQTHDLYSVADA